jgi:hypothetical protein
MGGDGENTHTDHTSSADRDRWCLRLLYSGFSLCAHCHTTLCPPGSSMNAVPQILPKQLRPVCTEVPKGANTRAERLSFSTFGRNGIASPDTASEMVSRSEISSPSGFFPSLSRFGAFPPAAECRPFRESRWPRRFLSLESEGMTTFFQDNQNKT